MSNLINLLPGVPLVESPFFERLLPEMQLSESEQQVACALNRSGYAVIDFPDPEVNARIDRIKARLAPRYAVDLESPDSIKSNGNHRIQDAWQFDQDVKAIATNSAILDLLSRLYGRRAFPFQTLNFPVGTQQHFHSDSIHFSSQPERFMCGVWLAMEDIHPDAGPLNYCPGSHRWPIISNTMLGTPRFGDNSGDTQGPYEAVWDAMISAAGVEAEIFVARKGQALIWAANLLHGGSRQNDPTRTRWSQVTHYYFADCVYYTPAFSEEPLGRLDLRQITNIATGEIEPNRLFGHEVSPPAVRPRKRGWRNLLARSSKASVADLPDDFDSEIYLRLNPDVAAAGEDAADHYRKHGRAENRRYRTL